MFKPTLTSLFIAFFCLGLTACKTTETSDAPQTEPVTATELPAKDQMYMSASDQAAVNKKDSLQTVEVVDGPPPEPESAEGK